MAGWTAASLIPSSLIRDAVNPKMTPAQKLKLSGGATRQALTTPSSVVTPGSTVPGMAAADAGAGSVITPGATSGANSATSVIPPATNAPPFLQGGAQVPSEGADALTQLLEAIGMGQKQDPNLVNAQTVLAQQQAMQVARGNDAARAREAQQAAMGRLQSQMKTASKYTTGGVGNVLMQRYADQAKVLQRDGELNWLNRPSTGYRPSGWTGPAMPGTWGL